MQRRLLLLLLPLFMLFAQQGAAWHELSHYRFDSNSGESRDAPGKKQPGDLLCDECLAFSAIAGIAAPHVPVLDLLGFEHSLAPAEAVHAAAIDAPSPRSRGPPFFL